MKNLIKINSIIAVVVLLLSSCTEMSETVLSATNDIYAIKSVDSVDPYNSDLYRYGLVCSTFANFPIKLITVSHTSASVEDITYMPSGSATYGAIYETEEDDLSIYSPASGSYYFSVSSTSSDIITGSDELGIYYPSIAPIDSILINPSSSIDLLFSEEDPQNIDAYVVNFYNASGEIIFTSEFIDPTYGPVSIVESSSGWIGSESLSEVESALITSVLFETDYIGDTYNVESVTRISANQTDSEIRVIVSE